jgi:hypothetical protein
MMGEKAESTGMTPMGCPSFLFCGDGADFLLRIHDLHITTAIDVAGSHLARTGLLHQHGP